MANSRVYYDEIRINVKNPEETHIWVYVRCEIDCPFMVQGWYHRVFPSSYTTEQFFKDFGSGKHDILLDWPKENPPQFP